MMTWQTSLINFRQPNSTKTKASEWGSSYFYNKGTKQLRQDLGLRTNTISGHSERSSKPLSK